MQIILKNSALSKYRSSIIGKTPMIMTIMMVIMIHKMFLYINCFYYIHVGIVVPLKYLSNSWRTLLHDVGIVVLLK